MDTERGESELGRKGGVRKPVAWTECVQGVGGLSMPRRSLMPLLGGSSAAPLVPSPVPVSTYQEHEEDGALVDVVH